MLEAGSFLFKSLLYSDTLFCNQSVLFMLSNRSNGFLQVEWIFHLATLKAQCVNFTKASVDENVALLFRTPPSNAVSNRVLYFTLDV